MLATETKIAVAMVAEVAMHRTVFIAEATLPAMSAAVVPNLREEQVQTVGQLRLVNLESAAMHGLAAVAILAAAAAAAGSVVAVEPTTAAAAAALATLTPA